MLSFFKKNILPVILGSGFLLLYISHLSVSVYGGDVGDLVTAAAVGGVAHPPGYPLFTFLGFLLTKTAVASISPAFAVGLISAFSAAAGVVGFYLLMLQLTKSKYASLIASLTLGFSFLYWFYAEIAEVFALNIFLAILLFLFAIVYKNTKKNIFLYVFVFFLGLSCTNHQTIIFVIPSTLFIVAKTAYKEVKKRPKSILFCFLLFLFGLTPFLYIPIASSFHPIINWDSVHDVSTFLHLILRKDYGTFQAGIFDTPTLSQRLVTVAVYLKSLVIQSTIPVIVLTLFGYYKLYRKDKTIFLSLAVAWFLSGPLFLFYAGFPLTSEFIIGAYERFTLLSSIIFLIPFGVGLLEFSTLLTKLLPKRNYEKIFLSVFLLIPLMLFFYNFPKTNLRSVSIGDTYAKDFLQVLPKNSVLLISGDTQIFNTWYMYYVLHVRPDILLYNIGATPVTQNEIAQKLQGVSSKNRTDTLIKIVETMQKTRPIFSTTRFQSKKGAAITWVPYGLTYQMYLSGDSIPDKKNYENTLDTVWSHMHLPSSQDMENPANHSLTIVGIPTDYSNALIAAGTFVYSQYKDIQKTILLYKQAVAASPSNGKAYSALGVLYTGIPGMCNESVANFSQSLAIDAYQELPYFLLYNEYIACFKDNKRADEVSRTYTELFKKDFQKEIKKSQDSLSSISNN